MIAKNKRIKPAANPELESRVAGHSRRTQLGHLLLTFCFAPRLSQSITVPRFCQATSPQSTGIWPSISTAMDTVAYWLASAVDR